MNRPACMAALLALLLPCAASLAAALGGGEKKDVSPEMPESEALKPDTAGNAGDDNEVVPQNRLVRVSGRVRLVGSAVFPELVISGENREWFILKDEQSLLFEFQQRVVTVEGTESYVDLTFANGLPAGRRYTLKNIRLIQ